MLRKVERDGTVVYRQSARAREASRFTRHDFADVERWPGAPIPLEWEPVPDTTAPYYETDPDGDDAGRVFVRLRRVTHPLPEVGVVIGATSKQEGTIHEAQPDEERYLTGPGRRVTLLEIALAPIRARSRIVLAHPNDITQLPGPPPS